MCYQNRTTAKAIDTRPGHQFCGDSIPRRSRDLMVSPHLTKPSCDAYRAASKYPPAKPGALGCEPLEAAVGVADAAPGLCWPPKGGPSTPQIHLLQAPILLFLFPNIFPYHLLVSPYCGDEVPSRPEVLSYEVPLLLSVHASQVYRALSLDKPDHLRHCVFRWDRDQHVHVIW